MKRKLEAWGVLIAAAVGAFSVGFIPTAAKAATIEECRTGTFTITDRPDSGVAGNWALDTFKRNIEVCRVVPEVEAQTVEIESWNYLIKGKDEGTFKTQGTKTPMGVEAGAEFAGRTGEFVGEWSLEFVAGANWANYLTEGNNPNRNDLSTSEWIAALWTGNPSGFKPGEFTNWAWTYTLCEDEWVNSAEGNTGDITAESNCPSPSPSPSVTTPAPTNSPTPAVTTPAATPSPVSLLPVTGTSGGDRTPFIIGAGVVLIVAGGLSLFMLRTRKARVEVPKDDL